MTPTPHPNQESRLPHRQQHLTLWKQLTPNQQQQVAQCLARLIHQAKNQSSKEEKDDDL